MIRTTPHKILTFLAIAIWFASTQSTLALGRRNAVNLDLQNPPAVYDPNLKDYVISARKRIQGMWVPQQRAKPQVKIQFTIDQNGQLEDIHLSQTSGDKEFDQQAMTAIFESTPFPAWPPQHLVIEANFDCRYQTPEEYAINKSRVQQIEERRTQKKLAAQSSYSRPTAHSNYINEQGVNSQQRIATAEDQTWRGSDNQVVPLKEIVIESNSQTQSEGKWTKLLSYNQLKNITQDQQTDYLNWFKQWLILPTEQKFPFLKSNPVVSHKSTRKRT